MLNELSIHAYLIVPPLGSYDVRIVMDWLESHQANIDCYKRILECIDDERKPHLVKGILNKVSIRQVRTLQVGRYSNIFFQIYAVHVLDYIEDKDPKIEDYLVLQ